MMQMHYFYETCTLAHREGRLPLFTQLPRRRVFSESGLAPNNVLGNSCAASQ